MTNGDTSFQQGKVENSSMDATLASKAAALRQDFLLDEALKETFPASDPVSMARFT